MRFSGAFFERFSDRHSNDAQRYRRSCCAVAIRVGGVASLSALCRHSAEYARPPVAAVAVHVALCSRAFRPEKRGKSKRVVPVQYRRKEVGTFSSPRRPNNTWVRCRNDYVHCCNCSPTTMMLSRQTTTRSAPSTSRTGTADAPEPS